MSNKTTVGTSESPLTQRHLHDVSAVATGLARVSRAYFDELSTASYGFVGQHTYETAPRSVTYSFSKMMVLNHISDLQVLNSNASEPCGEFVAEFVQEVSPLVADFVVLPSQPETSLAPVSAAFLLPAQSPMQHLQPLFTLNEEFRVSYDLTITQRGEVFQPDINSNLFGRRMLNFNIGHFASENGKPLPCPILFDSQGFDFALWNTVQDYWDVPYLGSKKTLIASKPETISSFSMCSALRVGDAVHPALESWKALFPTLWVFDSAKEVLKSLVNPIRNILPNLSIHPIIFISKMFARIRPSQSLSRFLVSFNGHTEKFVIDCFASLKRINQPYLLFLRRVNAVTIRPEFHRGGVV